MLRLEFKSSGVIDLEQSYKSQDKICDRYSNVFDVAITENLTSEVIGEDTRVATIFCGEYFNNLDAAERMSKQSDEVAKLLRSRLNATSNQSLMLFEYNNLHNIKDVEPIIDILNNISDRDMMLSLAPCNVDYIAVIMSADNNYLYETRGTSGEELKYEALAYNHKIGENLYDVYAVRVK